MNCQMWNTPEGCVLVDCRIMFPDDQQLGVDVVIPPPEPILLSADCSALLLTARARRPHRSGSVAGFFYQGLKVYAPP